MAYLLQLSASLWLNMDQVTLITHEGAEWQLTIVDQPGPLVLTPAQAAVLTYYLEQHGQREAYRQTTPPHRRIVPPRQG